METVGEVIDYCRGALGDRIPDEFSDLTQVEIERMHGVKWFDRDIVRAVNTAIAQNAMEHPDDNIRELVVTVTGDITDYRMPADFRGYRAVNITTLGQSNTSVNIPVVITRLGDPSPSNGVYVTFVPEDTRMILRFGTSSNAGWNNGDSVTVIYNTHPPQMSTSHSDLFPYQSAEWAEYFANSAVQSLMVSMSQDVPASIRNAVEQGYSKWKRQGNKVKQQTRFVTQDQINRTNLYIKYRRSGA